MRRMLMLLLPFAFHLLPGQSNQGTVESAVEAIVEAREGGNGKSQVADALDLMKEEHLNLNQASESDLEQIPGMTPLLARRIVIRRRQQRFSSLEELLDIEGMTPDAYEVIRWYVGIGGNRETGFSWPRVRVRSRMQAETNAGFKDPSWLGSPVRAYNRILIASERRAGEHLAYEAGMVSEKDPGERLSETFSAAYVHLSFPRINSEIIVGDFAIQSGKGLMFWRSSGVSKGGDILGPAKMKDFRLEPYRSTDENNFFRGVSVRAEIKPVTLSAFSSSRKVNGSVNGSGVLTTWDTDGLFRNEQELKTRSSSRERVYGGAVSLATNGGFDADIKGYHVLFDREVSFSRYRNFTGRDAGMVGMDIRWSLNMLSISAEVAADSKRSVASALAVCAEPSKIIRVLIASRRYPPSFNSLHGFGLSEGSQPEGEWGVYAGMILRPASWVKISCFYDTFVFPNRFLFEGGGNDMFAAGDFRLGGSVQFHLQIRKKLKPAEASADLNGLEAPSIGSSTHDRIRLSLIFSPSAGIRSQTRFERTRVSSTGEKPESGFLMLQEVRWEWGASARFGSRLIVFETDSYASRLYEFEQDVAGAFSSVSVWGSGIRLYMFAEVTPFHSVGLSLKYGQSLFDQKPGEDLRERSGRITVQCDLML